MFSKLKQIKDLRDKAKTLQDLLSQETAEGTAGWGKVKIQINGQLQITSVSIDPELFGDRSKLEQLICEAGNDALQKIQKAMANKLKESGGADLASEMQDLMK